MSIHKNKQIGKLEFTTPLTVIDFTNPTLEMIDAERMAQAKSARAAIVSNIIVEVDGMQFDGDESSQDRMTRAIVALDSGETILWVLADNSVVQVTREQLRQALRLAGLLLTEVWANPYIEEETNE